jgi:hypothetical protein
MIHSSDRPKTVSRNIYHKMRPQHEGLDAVSASTLGKNINNIFINEGGIAYGLITNVSDK